MARVLVIRLSALGDVAITIPVLYSVAKRYPEDDFVIVTKFPFHKIFLNKPDNLRTVAFDPLTQHDGIFGVWKLTQEINSIDKVADLHDVIRTKIIRNIYHLKQKKTIAMIDKGRKEKKELTRKKNKVLKPIATSIERYQKVFEELGYDSTIDFVSLFDKRDSNPDETRIGIAPFARHLAKTFPPEKMELIISHLSSRKNTKIYLFGGEADAEHLEKWEAMFPNTESIACKMNFKDELTLMNGLDLMISMDSANMHLASLVNIPVISIWGATHPYAGFYGFNQEAENCVQSNLDCRPCSIFGDKPCWRKDYACMKEISPEMIIEKVDTLLTSKIPNNYV